MVSKLKVYIYSIGLLALICSTTMVHGQQTNKDKLEMMLDSLAYIVDTSSNEDKVNALRALANIHIESGLDYKPALEMLNRMMELSEQLRYYKGLYWANIGLANYYWKIGKNDLAMEYVKKSMLHLRQIAANGDEREWVYSYRILSLIYASYGQLDSALFYMQRSIDCHYAAGDEIALSSAHVYLAHVYSRMGRTDKQIEAFEKAYQLRFSSMSGEREEIGGAALATSLGYAYMTSGLYKKALRCFFISDSIYSSRELIYPRHRNYHAKQAANIARVFQHMGQLDSAMKYRLITLDRYRVYGFPERVIDVPNQYCYIGSIYREKGDFEKAEEYINKAFDLRIQINDSLGVGMCLDEKAELSRLKGKYQLAIDQLHEAIQWKNILREIRIDATREAHQKESLVESYLIMSEVLLDWGHYKSAIAYLDTAMLHCRFVNYRRGEAIIYYRKALAMEELGEPDSAMVYFQRSLAMAIEMKNRSIEAQALGGIGKLLYLGRDYFSAIDHLESAINLYLEEGFIRVLPELYLYMGKALLDQGSPVQAQNVLNESYERARSLGMIRIQSEAARSLADTYTTLGDDKRTNSFLREYIFLHDSIFTLETHMQLAQIQADHESQKQEQQILQLEQQNEISVLKVDQSRYIIFTLGGIVIVILLFGVLFLRQVQIRNQQRILIKQQQLFRSQMNPHFIFNSLTNIQHYIFNKDSFSAGKYLAIFAKLMRSILNNSRKEVISLRDEVDTIEQYLELQKLRMDDKFDYEIIVDDALDPEILEIPPMLAQPFIENAIEHGIRNKEGKGTIRIRILKEQKNICYEVEDDGIGRQKAAELQSEKKKDHESMAVSLTRSRLQSLWGRKRPAMDLAIDDIMDKSGNMAGTIVRFYIPMR